MKQTKFTGVLNTVKHSVSKHTPELLIGFGITGMITSTILAVKSTPKAMKLIEKKKEELHVDKLTPGETIKVAWKCYIPSATIVLASTACLVGSSTISLKRNAALATAYKIVETGYKEYKDKVIETIGEKKEEAIREKIAKEKVEKNPVKNNEVIVTNNGSTLCYDVLSGRYFKTDIDKIKKAVNEVNRRMITDVYVSLNDFYYELGLEGNKLGDELGWNIDKGLLKLDYSSILTENDEPCLVIDYEVAPKYNYSSLY